MPGSKTGRTLLTERDMRFLRELAIARVVDQKQASALAGFGIRSAANARLLKLVRLGVLNHFFLGTLAGGKKALYTLSRKGAQQVQSPLRLLKRRRDALLVGDQFIEHQLAVNEIYIQAKCLPQIGFRFHRWLNFAIVLSNSVPLVPDGYFEGEGPRGTLAMFCEVDRGTESLRVWKQKVSLYLRLATTGEFERLFGERRFGVLVIVPSPGRLKSLRRTVIQQTEKIFWFSTIENINRDGLFSAHWLRPVGEETHSLL